MSTTKIYLEKHKLVEWIVPLHQKDAIWRCGTQVAVSVIRILANTSSKAVSCLRHTLRW